MVHPNWNGLTFYDLIFPLFLFISGVASPYSKAKEFGLGKSKGQVILRTIKKNYHAYFIRTCGQSRYPYHAYFGDQIWMRTRKNWYCLYVG